MSESRFSACLSVVLAHEGGFADHPRDPGGPTRFGITQATLASARGRPVSRNEVRRLTLDEAAAIYHARYWLPLQADSLPVGLDLAVFDYCVNSGQRRAVTGLQRAVGADADGLIGPKTLAGAARAERVPAIRAICAGRLAFLQDLSGWRTFGKGWRRRVQDVESRAVSDARAAVQVAFTDASR